MQLMVKDDGSVVMKKFGKNSEEALGKTAHASTKTGNSLQKLKGSYLALTAAAAAFAVVASSAVRVATASVQAFMEEEAAQMRLAVAMGNAGTYTRQNLEMLKDYAAQLQQNTKFGDEMTLSMMANLQTYGMDIAVLKEATQASMDLAAAKGMDLVAASELVGKAFVGETGTLARYGIVLSDNIEKSDKFSAVLAIIQQRFGGSATAELETYAGQWAKIKNWWGDMAEKVGLTLLKVLEAIQFALGMVVAGFYTLLEKVTAKLSDLVSYAEKLPLIGSKFTGLRKELDFISQGYGNAKDSALGFADTNLKMLTSFDRVGSFADKIYKGKKGSSVVNPLAGADKEAQDLLKSWTDIESRMKNEMELAGLDDLTKKLVQNQQEAEGLIAKFGKIPGAIALITQAWDVADREAILAAEAKAIDEYNKRLQEQAEKERQMASERLAAQHDIYQDLRGYEDSFYTVSEALIEEQAQRYRDLKIDEVAIAAWAAEEKRKIQLKLYQTVPGAKTFGEGWKEGLRDWGKSLGTEFSQAQELATTTAESMSSTFSDLFFDSMKGECKSFRSYFASFNDAILRNLTDTTGKMVSQWILSLDEMGNYSAAKGLAGFIGQLAGSLSGSGSAGSTAGSMEGGTFVAAMAEHKGGIVGKEASHIVYVPSAAFANAPRYHNGFMPGERPAIIKDDEAVLTPGQMAALGRDRATEINIANIVSPDMMDAYLASPRGKNAMLNVIGSNAGAVRRVIRG